MLENPHLIDVVRKARALHSPTVRRTHFPRLGRIAAEIKHGGDSWLDLDETLNLIDPYREELLHE